MYPMVEAVGAEPVFYDIWWEPLLRKSYTLGTWAQALAGAVAGSRMSGLVPFRDERRFLRAIIETPAIAHFIWAEIAWPLMPGRFREKGCKIVGTFHATATRQREVLRRTRALFGFDWITLMSATQKPFFLERGYPEERLCVILHGVDSRFFCPDPARAGPMEGPIRGLVVGSTERDHVFLADVMRKVPAGTLELSVLTSPVQQGHYKGIPNVKILPPLADEELRAAYRQADLLIMPMQDCTANNVIMEAMACGTPVMTNRVGGIPEYVSPESSYLFDKKEVAMWVDCLVELKKNKDRLWHRRVPVREWAESFDWDRVSVKYKLLYEQALKN